MGDTVMYCYVTQKPCDFDEIHNVEELIVCGCICAIVYYGRYCLATVRIMPTEQNLA